MSAFLFDGLGLCVAYLAHDEGFNGRVAAAFGLAAGDTAEEDAQLGVEQ